MIKKYPMLMLLLISPLGQAQSPTAHHEEYDEYDDPVEDDETGWRFGLGVSVETETYIGNKDRIQPFPLISYSTERWSFSPGGIEYTLFETEEAEDELEDDGPSWGLSLSLGVEPGFGSRSTSDARIFEGMEKRKDTTNGAIGIEIESPIGFFEIGASSDITGEHDGISAEASYNFPLFFSRRARVLGFVGLEYHDDNYVDYYYGVRASEVRADRAAYTGTAASNPFAGYRFMYQINERWGLFHATTFTWLDDSIVNSTLTTDEDTQFSTFLGIEYRL